MVQTTTVVSAPGGYVLAWGWFSIELANLLIILTMIVLFVVAILVPFGRAHADPPDRGAHDGDAHHGESDDGDADGVRP